EYRKDQLHGDLARLLLRGLPHARAQISRVGSQRGAEAGSEALAVDEHVRQLPQIRISRAVAELAHRVGARFAGAQLEMDLPQLGGQVRMRQLELSAGVDDGLVQRLSGLQAQHQKIQR